MVFATLTYFVGGSPIDRTSYRLGNEVPVEESASVVVYELQPMPLESGLLLNTTVHVQVHAISLWGWRWQEVSSYLITIAFLIFAAVVKVLYHHSFIHNHVPESCVLILFGTLFELILYLTGVQQHVPSFNNDHFFFLLLPPIILESAYSLHDRVFFSNLGTVLLYAVVGTVINVVLIGPSLYLLGLTGLFGIEMPLLESLTFSTLISAVDPVAVLAIFQELGVNKALYFLVFGESLLNDAVVIVLYNSVTVFAASETIEYMDVLFGFLNFFTVSCGGLTIGIIIGGITALITRYTNDVRVVEPLVVITMAYLSYVMAELFHFSGIISLIGCGLMQIEYSKPNISSKSYVTIKYFTKNLSSISDVIIFFFLGKVLVRETHVWNTAFVVSSTLFCVVYRFLSVFTLTMVANHFFNRMRLINFEEQLVMAYGGLRGAIAFSLAIMLDKNHIKNADLFVTTTLFVILFTVFVMGATTKTVVRLLSVKIEDKSDPKMFIFVSNKATDTLMMGIEEIIGVKSTDHWLGKMSRINDKYVKPLLIAGGPSAGNGYTEVYEKVKNHRPRSTIFAVTGALALANQAGKSVRFSHTNSNENINHATHNNSDTTHTINDRWMNAKNPESIGTAIAPLNEKNENGLRSRRQSRSARRRSSLFTRRDSVEEEKERDRQALSSALSRTEFYQLPGTMYNHDDTGAKPANNNTVNSQSTRNRAISESTARDRSHSTVGRVHHNRWSQPSADKSTEQRNFALEKRI
ncbi:Sodium/hydrogen exchanger 2 [Halotydeus destructor]|nr:Sodium/hydrogen exchanger 2 [Halotydeus destructor]